MSASQPGSSWFMRLKQESVELAKSILKVYWTLIKVTVPALVAVKLLDMAGGTQLLAWILSPVMSLVGLPESMGVVWSTVLLTNIYAGMALLVDITAQDPLTVAQISVLGAMMLVGHGLPVEGAVAKSAGVSWRATLAIRVGGGLALGALLHLFYSATGLLQQPAHFLWRPAEGPADMWWLAQIKTWGGIFFIIVFLMTFLRMLRWLGVEKWMHALLFPVLRVLGIGREAANVTVIGVTLGLSFGAGLLIEEARSGCLTRRDIFLTMGFLGLCHSLIEDTLVIMLLGADMSAILWGRLLFALVVIGVLARLPVQNRRLREAAA
ncbi:hypothetical protein EUZ85_11175 [Hahella sp. KA22]|uniref:hypothetical protein n=1 Tax=Hahella sp. KA22 TaxID=1628392 RepID=UPI000FDD05C9|nr:hypothetical protein [Hahella sp. KA22]AZZ91259.1 hypothetical protein ENC22_08620 [Hahella sp. KA22]QAY54627.1 hypothetical protein EUZ85_11175 [Hahella sp. KA22]